VTPRFNQHRSVRLEWWAVVAALVLLIGAIATRQWLWRADQLLYDAALAVWERPAPRDIVIVAIDDRSLAQVGRWPWRRAVHATLINRLTEDGAKAVGLDLLLSDRDAKDAASDASLAEAMRRSKRVVLPLVLAPTDRPELDDQLPLPELAKAALLGFAYVVIDADGIVRRMRLREKRNNEELSSFALRVLAVAADPHGDDAAPVEPAAWAPGVDTLSLPFAGPPGHFRQISYVDVLRGNVPAGFFHDKIVLIGATATGLVGRYATPVSGLTQTMSGVEIQANAIDALRRPILIRTVPPEIVAAVTVVALALLLFLLRQASARAGLPGDAGDGSHAAALRANMVRPGRRAGQLRAGLSGVELATAGGSSEFSGRRTSGAAEGTDSAGPDAVVAAACR
jgi:CHASE2 domain-containing sensor protein